MTALAPADHTFFAENGYLVVRNVVPPAQCNAVVDTIWDFLDMNRNDPDDWYHLPLKPGGMIEMYQNQALWDTRQYPRLYETFASLLGEPDLCVTIDRAGMKPPYNSRYPDYDHTGFTHWDTDTSRRPLASGVQGVLCLTDTDADMGGFQCVPGFHKNLEAWIAEQPADRNVRVPDLSRLPPGMAVTPIPARQGDLILWNILLAHGNGRNLSNRPRYSQYISMFPAARLSDTSRQHRVECWRNRLPPGDAVFPGDAREIEQSRYATAELTPLGRRLLGLDAWE